MALKCWLSRTITETQITEGEKYMLDYLKGVHEVKSPIFLVTNVHHT